MPNINLKPNKLAFILFSLRYLFIVSLVVISLSVIVVVLTGEILISVVIFGLFGLILLLSYGYVLSEYLKESYSFGEQKFIAKSGSIFSESTTELKTENITQIVQFSGFLQRWFLGTATIIVKAAGSSTDEVVLRHISDPNLVYGQVQEAMTKAGFILDKDKAIASYEPDLLGVLSGSVLRVAGNIFTLIFSFGLIFLVALDGIRLENTLNFFIASMFLVGALTDSVKIIFDLIHQLKTKYILYPDKVVYKQDWLNYYYDIIPLENISDLQSSQNWWQRIVGVSDLKISCQGSDNEIVLSYIRPAQEFRKQLSLALESLEKQLNQKSDQKDPEISKSALKQNDKETITRLPTKNFGNAFTATLEMSLVRVMGGYGFWLLLLLGVFLVFLGVLGAVEGVQLQVALPVLFILIFVYLSLIIYGLIKVTFTKYYIKENSLSQEFVFINTRRKEFSLDKITGLEIKRNWLDLWFKTCSISIQSIGSAQTVNFESIDFDPDLISQILQKINITPQPLEREHKAEFAIPVFIQKNLFFLITLGLVWIISSSVVIFSLAWFIIITLILLLLVGLSFLYEYLYFQDHSLHIYPNYVVFREGWISKREVYASFFNIKNLRSIQYPVSSFGKLKIDIAGHRVILDNPEADKQTGLGSFECRLQYYPQVKDLHNNLELWLYRHPFRQTKTVTGSAKFDFTDTDNIYKPSISLYLSFLILISVIATPLLLLLPVTAFWLIAWYKKLTFQLEPERVVISSGLFYKSQTTLQYNRIDHITKSQNFIQKIFNVATLEIFTTGSSSAEGAINNVKDYQGLFAQLQQKY